MPLPNDLVYNPNARCGGCPNFMGVNEDIGPGRGECIAAELCIMVVTGTIVKKVYHVTHITNQCTLHPDIKIKFKDLP